MTSPGAGPRRPPRRAALLGAAAGAAVTLPAVFLALTLPVFELVVPLLLPGPRLLATVLGDAPADWPGAVNLLLACAANAVVWGGVAAGVVALTRALSR